MNNNEFNNNQPSAVNPSVPVQPVVPTTPVVEPLAPVMPTTPVEAPNNMQPTMPANDVVQPNNNMEPKKNNTMLLIIVGIIVVAIIAAVVYFAFLKNNDTNDNETEKPQTEETNKPDENPVNNADLSVWNGVYVNNGVSITIYQSAPDVVSIDISTSPTNGNTDSGSDIGFDVDVTSETKIVYDDDFLEEGANIVIERTDNGIMVTASSDESDSLLNNINGSYVKETFTEYGWSGTYKNGEISVILSEVAENYVVCTITKGYTVVSFSFDEVTATTLDYEDTWDNDKVSVMLIEAGIQINATVEDPDSLLKEINGNYTKELGA